MYMLCRYVALLNHMYIRYITLCLEATLLVTPETYFIDSPKKVQELATLLKAEVCCFEIEAASPTDVL